LDQVIYEDPAAGGAVAGSAWPNKGSNNKTIELLSPTMDNDLPANWAVSISATGTPMAVNRTSAVADWSMY